MNNDTLAEIIAVTIVIVLFFGEPLKKIIPKLPGGIKETLQLITLLIDVVKNLLYVIALPFKALIWVLSAIFGGLRSVCSSAETRMAEARKDKQSQLQQLIKDDEDLMEKVYDDWQLIKSNDPKGLLNLEKRKIKHGEQNVNEVLKVVQKLDAKSFERVSMNR